MATDMSFTIKGGKIGILLLHRLCGTPVEMRFVATGLAKEGYTVHCPQLAGHCGSADEISASTWCDWYSCAEAALDALCDECDVVIAGGLSTGAVLAAMLAARQPDRVQATALLAPTLRLNGWMIPWYAKLFRLIRHKAVARLFSFAHHHPYGIKDERIREFVQRARQARGAAEAGHPRTPGAAIFEHGRLCKAMRKLIPSVRQPSLILHPLEDDYAALSNATHLAESLGGPVELVVLDDCYHIVTVDRQRHLVVDAISRFAARIGAVDDAAAAAARLHPVPERAVA